jgi:PAT family beta-lactamase induction signal transducer AmpG
MSSVSLDSNKLKNLFGAYYDRRMFRILLLGIISGFPWVLIGSALSLWLKEEGLSRSTIGWAGLIFGVYAINFLWAPIIDRLRLPFLTNKIGHRKSIIIFMQTIILISLILWSTLEPTQNLALIIGIGLAIAISSATQDITIDALRIEQINKEETSSMAAGAAMAVVGWWTGFKLGGFICLEIAERLELSGVENYWQITFIFLMAIIVLSNVGLSFIPESNKERFQNMANLDKSSSNVGSLINASYLFAAVGALCVLIGQFFGKVWFTNGGYTFIVIAFSFYVFSFYTKKYGDNNVISQSFFYLNNVVANPLSSFFKNNGVKIGIAILAFVFLFKIGEAFLGRMSLVFYKEIGFSIGDIAIFFTLIGGAIAMRSGIVKTLIIAGIAMAATNILFSVLAWAGPSKSLFAIAVILDDLAAAFATVAFVAFISLMVDRSFTATQYALLASVGTAGRTLLASSSGAMVDGLGGNWGLFFIITALMVIPSLICLMLIKGKLNLPDKS